MDYMTLRLLFPREAVLSLMDEPAFEHCFSLEAVRDVKPFRDVYVAVFVVEVSPVPGVGLRLRPVSTTAVGTTKTAAKSMVGSGFLWADVSREGPSMELLRSHYCGEEAFVRTASSTVGFQMPSWRNFYRNCGGDVESVPEIVIEDPVAKEMERLFGSDSEL